MKQATMAPNYCYKLPWLHAFIFLLIFSFFSTGMASGSQTQSSYQTHCASFVPESHPIAPEFTTSPFSPFQDGYYDGGDRFFDLNSSSEYSKTLYFRTRNVYRTDVVDVFKFEAVLYLKRSKEFNYVRNNSLGNVFPSRTVSRQSYLRSLNFMLHGFWSTLTGKICMVGSNYRLSQEGNFLYVVLKLEDVKNTSTVTSLVKGTLETMKSADDLESFETISIFLFPQLNYKYTKALEEVESGCSGGTSVSSSSSIKVHLTRSVCSIFSRFLKAFELKYSSDCNHEKTCNPFGEHIEHLPRVMSLKNIMCSEDQQSLRSLIRFSNTSFLGFQLPFDTETTLVAEGSWNEKKNQLCVVACRILNLADLSNNIHVGDCSIRLYLRLPEIWSIRNTSTIVGQMRSNKNVNVSGYFPMISFRSSENELVWNPGLRYEYTETDRVKRACPMKKPNRNKARKYPSGYSREMGFDMSISDSKGEAFWGYSIPISVADQISSWYPFSSHGGFVQAKTKSNSPLNISYKMILNPLPAAIFGGRTLINLLNSSLNSKGQIQITAEGVYGAETGDLCMVGCREFGLNNPISRNDSMDCEIVVSLQFPPLNSSKSGGYIEGKIESTREKSDPLYFEPLSLSSAAYSLSQAKQSILRMNWETILLLLFTTNECYCAALQLLYVKKHPNVLPFISLLMVLILTLGLAIPLVLNYEAMFFQNATRQTLSLESGGWLEVNEATVRTVKMVAFLLQFRLLQLTWSSRTGDQNQKALWVAEKKAFFTSLPLYISGGFVALFVNWTNNKSMFLGRYLRSYAGLVLDGFLFPQILVNMFQNSKEYSLSSIYYIGITCIRLVPHAYDLYRAQNHPQNHIDGSYIYASPQGNFYSTFWDVIILVVGLVFSAVIFLQQQFGGRFFLPEHSHEVELYEKAPVGADDM